MKSKVYILLDRFLKGKSTKEEENSIELFEREQLEKNKNSAFSNEFEAQQLKYEVFNAVASKTFNKNNWSWIQVAASIAIMIGLGFGYFSMKKTVEVFEIANNTAYIKNISLDDGTKVVLNTGSSIKYTANFNDDDRQVELCGEAFFDVFRNENKPFIVTTGKLKTQVLGTSFNICKTDSLVSVTVSTGLVQVYDEHNVIRIRPNQEATYYTKTKDLNKRNVKSELITSWFQEDIELANVSMKELAELMEKRFDTKLSFSDANLANKRLTIAINKNDSIKTIINRINQIKELKLIKTQANIIEVQKK